VCRATELLKKLFVFEVNVLTTTDVAVACNLTKLGNLERIENLNSSLIESALLKIKELVEVNIDKIKTEAGDAPLIFSWWRKYNHSQFIKRL